MNQDESWRIGVITSRNTQNKTMSQRPRPHERWGQESFRHRSVIGSPSDAQAKGAAVDEIGASDSKPTSTPLTSSRTEALKRLHLAANTIILTNDLKIEHNDEARERLHRATNAVIMPNKILLRCSDSSLTSRSATIEEETPEPITSHPRNAGIYTVVAFVNSASGGGMGKRIFKSLQDHLGPSYVIDLHSCRPGNMPEDSLLQYAYDPMVRVLACGGDGTCGWMLSCLDKVWLKVLEAEKSSSQCDVDLLKYKDYLPLAIMPLGTGNDLSRQFGWGGTFQPHMQKMSMISSVQRSKLTSLDIWRCIIMPVEKLAEEERKLIPQILGESYKDAGLESSVNSFKLLNSLIESDESQKGTMSKPSNDVYDGVLCNYLSLGFDALVAYRFHQERETHPEKFTSPLKNKLIYVMNTPYALTSPKLRSRVRMLVNDNNGQLIPLKIPRSCRAIVLMNIQSYGGGNRLSSGGSPADGLIEIVFVSNIFRAASVCALSPVLPFVRFKVATKSNNVYIRTMCPLHCQVDGEPWLQDEGVFQVKFHSRKSVLEKESDHANCGCISSTKESVVE